MATTKRRRRKHAGVVLIKPDPVRRIGWRARFKDPDSGKLVKVSLDPALSTKELREAWAVRKSRELEGRRIELAAGAPRATGTMLKDALDRYFKAHTQLSARTLTIYRTAADKLLAWAEGARVRSADDLTRAKLLGFRESLIQTPKHAIVTGEGVGRGKRAATSESRSAASVNQELRSARTVLGYLRELDLLPRLTHDDLRRALRRLPGTSERIQFLRPQECQQLLEAALLHDAETYVETREEHAGQRRAGTTARYDPIAPFTAGCLLGGFRVGEAIGIDWKQVDLDALDHEGRVAGEIHVTGAGTKTRNARTVGLEVSPALHKLLSAVRLANGGKGSVFGLSKGTAEAAAKRLRDEYGAPEAFTWQTLRRTCGTFLTNAPGIFGAASAYRSARQLGHSVQVAERHYLGLVRGIPPTARTLEAAMQIEDVMARLTASLGCHQNATSVAAAEAV